MSAESSSVYWITGGSGGIGSALAEILIERGDRVVLSARRIEPLRTLERKFGIEHARVIPLDVLDSDALELAAAQIMDDWGRLDGLAHCVGSILLKPLHAISTAEFRSLLELNLVSAFSVSRAALKPMRQSGQGSVVLCSTVAARQGLANHEAIAAAKAGIEGFVRSAAISHARSGIRFNAVAPGLTETPLAAPLLRNEASRQFSEALHPMGRLGQPEEVARAIAFLLSSESSWVTGQVLGADGGLSAGVAPPRPTVVTRT